MTSTLLKVRSSTDAQMVARELKVIESYVNKLQKPAFVSGSWYGTPGTLLSSSTTPGGANTIKAYPFKMPFDVSITDLAGIVATLHAANNFQLAIYANSLVTNRPTGSELGKTGNISTAATGAVSAALAGGTLTLLAGTVYWMMSNHSGSTAIMYCANSSNNLDMANLVGGTLAELNAATGVSIVLSTAKAFGTWGDLSAAAWAGVAATSAAVGLFKVA